MPGRPLHGVIRYLHKIVVGGDAAHIPDEQLLERFATQRDEAAFELLVGRHSKTVLGVCHRLLRDTHAVEDAFQATFLALARRASSISKRASVGGWLYKVAYRAALQAKAQTSKRTIREIPLQDVCTPAAVLDPGADAERRELRLVIDGEVNRLPDKYRLPLVLCYFEGKSHGEAARELGCPLGTVESRLTRARERLRARLTRRGVVPSVGLLAAVLSESTASAWVPTPLVMSTAKVAARVAAGQAMGAASASVAALTEGVLRAMWMTKLRIIAVVLAVGLLGSGAGWFTHRAWGEKPLEIEEDHLIPQQAGVDVRGDDAQTAPAVDLAAATSLPAEEKQDADAPLPAGAVMRLGERRFRPGVRITHLAFSPDGKQLASWGNWLYFEDRILIWDVTTGKELHTQAVPEHQIADLCWGPSGRGFAAMGDGYLRLFSDLASRAPAPNRERVAKTAPAGIPKVPPKQEGSASYQFLALAPDGSRVAVVRTAAGSAAGSVDLLESKAGERTMGLKRLATRDGLPPGKCTGLRFARGGKTIVVLMDNKGNQSVVLWEPSNGSLSDPITVPMGVQQGNRQSFDVAEDGSTLAVGLADGTVKVFELPSGKERLSVKKHDGPAHGRSKWSEVSAVKFVNGGRNLLTAGRDLRQLVWDARTGAEVAVLNGHASWVEAVAVSQDSKLVATAGQDSLIRLWDAATWQPILAPKGPSESIWRLEVSRDGKYAAGGSNPNSYVWELASGREVRSVASHYSIGHVLFSPEGALVTGNAEGSLSLYPLPIGAPKLLAAKGKLLDFTPDGRTLLTAQGNTVCLWDWPECTQRQQVSVKGEPLSAAIAPDDKTAVIAMSGVHASAIVTLASSQTPAEMPLQLHWFSRAAGFSADNRLVCGTVGSPQAEAWNVKTRSLVRKFEQPPQKPPGHFYLLGFAVSPDGRRAASCQSDGGVTIYEMATGQMLAHFSGHRQGVIAVAWTPDGNRVLSGGGDHQVLIWDVSLRTLAGNVVPLSAPDRLTAWDHLGTQTAKDAIKTMAALAADPEGTTRLFAAKMKPVPEANPAILDRIFRDLDDVQFPTRARASRELDALGAGAIAGVRERIAKGTSAEVNRRASQFLGRFDEEAMTPDRIRVLRALEVLASMNIPAARKLVENLAAGASEVWETEVARQTLRGMNWAGPK